MIDSPEDREELLRHARATAAEALGRKAGAPATRPNIEGRFGGMFVSLWRGRRLRGCIGTLAATTDIVATVEEMTRASLKDPRFTTNPVLADELSSVTIEISVLSDPAPTKDALSLVPGVHGIVVRHAGRSGCFLPKVAAERGWSAEELLSTCCTVKAGLPADAWRRADTDVLLFTAEVFSERPGG